MAKFQFPFLSVLVGSVFLLTHWCQLQVVRSFFFSPLSFVVQHHVVHRCLGLRLGLGLGNSYSWQEFRSA